jgi:hypothetical protein
MVILPKEAHGAMLQRKHFASFMGTRSILEKYLKLVDTKSPNNLYLLFL